MIYSPRRRTGNLSGGCFTSNHPGYQGCLPHLWFRMQFRASHFTANVAQRLDRMARATLVHDEEEGCTLHSKGGFIGESPDGLFYKYPKCNIFQQFPVEGLLCVSKASYCFFADFCIARLSKIGWASQSVSVLAKSPGSFVDRLGQART